MLIGRLGLPRTEETEELFRRWQSEVPSSSALDLLDLNYLENRLGPWASAKFCCDPSVSRYNPIGTTRSVELMLSLPEEWKREYRLSQFAIERLWPELASIPINSRGRFRDFLEKASLAISNPETVVRKLRKSFH
jgi:predicted glycosyltransferase